VHDGLENLGDPGAHLRRGEQHVLRLYTDQFTDLVASSLRLGGRKIDLVHHGDDLEPRVEGEKQIRDRLGFDALARVHHQEGALAGFKAPAHLVGEIDVSRRVDQVELVLLTVRGPIGKTHRVQLDRDPALPLQVHRVEDLLLHLAGLHRTRRLQQSIGERRLAVVDVGHDGKVANQVLRHIVLFARVMNP
jgi:hypothetical protein